MQGKGYNPICYSILDVSCRHPPGTESGFNLSTCTFVYVRRQLLLILTKYCLLSPYIVIFLVVVLKFVERFVAWSHCLGVLSDILRYLIYWRWNSLKILTPSIKILLASDFLTFCQPLAQQQARIFYLFAQLCNILQNVWRWCSRPGRWQWIWYVQGRVCRRRRPQGCVPLHRWKAKTSGKNIYKLTQKRK